jgi:S-layer protein (TIGR01564 family)
MVDTYIVFDSDLSDQRSAQLIAAKLGYKLLQTAETANPAVCETKHDDNNIVCVGGPLANAYTKYYFPNLRLDKLYNWDNFPGQKNSKMWKWAGVYGISADGKRVITTIKRKNGTTVTVVAGIDEVDTWNAANHFVKKPMSILVPVSVVAAVAGVGVYIGK